MISDAILIPKIYARLQEIASNFSKFSGGPRPPAGSRAFGLGFTAPPLSKIPGSAPGIPVILYGLEACPLTKSDLVFMDFVINRFFNEII